jgi:hypothetical protein
VDSLEHVHGAFNPVVRPGAIYAPGSGGIKRSTDDGETWSKVYDSLMTHMVGTTDFLYADAIVSPHLVRSAADDGTAWTSYCTAPSGIDNGQLGPGTQTMASSSDGTHWYIVLFNNSGGVWRYIE